MPTTSTFLAGLLVVLGSSSAAAQCLEWSPGFGRPGVDARVNAFATFDEGSGPRLFAAGAFTHADELAAERIARWDGSAWSPLGSGLDGEVTSLCVFDDGSGPALYAGGAFGVAGGVTALSVARWNGTSWSAVGSGFDQVVLALHVHDDGSGPALYAGGVFTHAGATLARRLARWNGTDWVEVGGGLSAPIDALTTWNGALAAGGEFATAGATGASNIALWDGVAWSALGPGLPSAVLALAAFDDGTGSALYAGGEFFVPGTNPIRHIARWDGAAWSPLGSGTGNVVRRLLPEPGVGLHAAGDFFSAGGVSTAGVALWTGTTWVAEGGPRFARTLARFDDGTGGGVELFSGGSISPATGMPLLTIARRRGGTWRPLGAADGLQGSGSPTVMQLTAVLGMSPALDGVYAVGEFHTAGDSGGGSVARFDGVRWHALGSGIGSFGYPWCVAAFDGGSGPEIVVGGAFDQAGGIPANRIARWNGTSWQTLGSGTNDIVTSLEVFDDGSGTALYAAGYFSQAGGVPALRIARWNGTSWQAVGAGLPATVLDLAVFDDGNGPKLYAGGGSPGVVHVWDGVAWTPIASTFATGSPLQAAVVIALAAHDDGTGMALYASGTFTVPAQHLARWNGTTWSDVGGGIVDGYAEALQSHDDGSGGGPRLYATGNFTQVGGGVACARIARWDGSAWNPVGAGLDASGTGLAVWEHDLYVGGAFAHADGLPSERIARWKGCGPVSSFCAGDGLDDHVTTDCPCGNSGGAGRGCGWHAGPAGALLEVSGGTNPDTLVLAASGMPNSAPSTIFLKGDALIAGGVVFGDGVRCAGGNLIRLGTKANVNGSASFPEPGNPSISDRGLTPPGSGLVGYYQTYYRNAAAFCTSATFNVTNGVRVEW